MGRDQYREPAVREKRAQRRLFAGDGVEIFRGILGSAAEVSVTHLDAWPTVENPFHDLRGNITRNQDRLIAMAHVENDAEPVAVEVVIPLVETGHPRGLQVV